ncbi:hypothetical protein [Thermanaeromonas sp. C210]|uniref:hypothetical protein n=1 Tax=Thermanaeromonas sp. C210 TaxID=2731925 RepID=UPI00155B7176|nr:hypothetical protein [Thermanaeromonas sp. C210]GFN22770.1 hypothetical protein TAMC210_10870 [Thermanaeromonas sp. C210]
MEDTDLTLVQVLSWLKTHQLQNMSTNELVAVLGLIDLMGILSLVQGSAPAAQGKGRTALQEALNSVLQAPGAPEGGPNPAELAASLAAVAGAASPAKNAALVNTLLNLLMSMKEGKPKEKETTETKPPEEKSSLPTSGRHR